MTNSSIISRWETIREHIRVLRPHARLVAVSKGQPSATIESLLALGQRDFAENRVQEAMSKWPKLKAAYPDVRLHLIGPLQTNKVKEALSLFDILHTLDRETLADALIKACGAQASSGKQFFIQVNIGDEPQKNGVAINAVGSLLDYCRTRALDVCGLMCIPPADDLPAPYFALLRTLSEKLGLSDLSMGMSGDYETALRLGATYIRVGTALFGKRDEG